MNAYAFELAGEALQALPSGALAWPGAATLIVSDLHLGRSERYARRGGALLPPYEVEDTLARLDADIGALAPRRVICLGDSFDDLAAAALDERALLWLARLMAGRHWIWIEGNHDPGPVALGGEHRAEMALGPLRFRHVATETGTGEISGHYHPKLGIAGRACRCFLADSRRVILPAYGTYTGGLRSDGPVLSALMGPGAIAILTGAVARPLPLPREAPRRC
ncbi:ligase-associated DNA damage response endonuclease PdeM [Albidovulum sp.]|uniref:ligase-associated DNA damage response endonuclease PdeM n=1 Tax=Albidovulum sp. TaxID=1872424 RepID=UPI001D9AC897|nr:ligase-associated DNA damage response endonuclease PdeM [Paracoccaceae bacterium]